MNFLYESQHCIIQHYEHPFYKEPVCIKRLKQTNHQQLKQLENEYSLTHQLNITGVRPVYQKIMIAGQTNLVLGYFDGISLKEFIQKYNPTLLEQLKIAISICKVLEDIHQQHIIHKDLNPANILIQPKTLKVCIIDFGIATRFQYKTHNLGNPATLEGTLAYISPEQTGRINRTVDWRADLYALGATFYELFTGSLPFKYEDPLMLVHAHITLQPKPLQYFNKQLPNTINSLVFKLMEKEVNKRYKSVKGLKADLEKCFQQFQKKGKVSSFSLGQQDILGKLHIPEKLYGRTQEIHDLLAIYQKVANNSKGLILIGGEAGVGKTALVREIHKPVLLQNGFFIEGKFEQFQRNLPYHAWKQAFDQLIRYILTENEDKLNQWKNIILTAIGNNGELLTDMIPSLSLLLGKQPAIHELSETEAQNRFNYAIQSFIRAVATEKHPLVIFLDDWQWADVASQQLLKLLMNDQQLKHLLIIGAYRQNEIPVGSLFLEHIQYIQQRTPIFKHLVLHNLHFEDIVSLVHDTLGENKQDYTSLANLLFIKTHGNAFFIKELLYQLYYDNLLKFNFQIQAWEWDNRQTVKVDIADNLIDLMVEKIKKMPIDIQKVLQLSACLGTQFDLETLSVISQQAKGVLSEKLEKAFIESLLVPIENGYKFSHDEIYKAVYSLIPTPDLLAIHWQIAKFLYKENTANNSNHNIFAIVNQWNIAIPILTNASEKKQLAGLNYLAAEKAKAANAYETSIDYLELAADLLADVATWKTAYDLHLSIYTLLTQVSNLLKNYEDMEAYRQIVLAQANNTLDKVAVEVVAIQSYLGQHKLDKSIDIGLAILEKLGIKFPTKIGKHHIILTILHTKLLVAKHKIDKLIFLPKMLDEEKVAATQILIEISVPAYFGRSDLLPLLLTKQVSLALKYGNTIHSPYTYMSYAFLSCAILGDIEEGYRLGKLALELGQQEGSERYLTKMLQLFNATIRHWKDPLVNTLAGLKKGYEVGLENGDLEFASLCVGGYSIQGFESGKNLRESELEFAQNSEILSYLDYGPSCLYHAISYQLLLKIAYPSKTPTLLVGQAYDERETITQHRFQSDTTGLFHLQYCKIRLYCLFNDYEGVAKSADIGEKYVDSSLGTIFNSSFFFYTALAYLNIIIQERQARKNTLYIKKIKKAIKKIKKWASKSPTNYLHRFYILQAVYYQYQQNFSVAKEYYAKSIDTAKKSGFIHEEALACELAGRFYLANHNKRLARYHLQHAFETYQKWGAKAKTQQLKQTYQSIISLYENTDNATISTTNSLSSSANSFMLEIVLKATQKLANQLVLNSLLPTLLQILKETTGAEEVILINTNNLTAPIIEAKDLIRDGIQLQPNHKLSNYQHIAHRIVNYVLRTEESVLEENAWKNVKYVNAPYIQGKQVRSVLCFPLFKHEKIIRVIYLENNTLVKAFTNKHIQLLQLLTTHINIAFENVARFQKLENEK